VGGFLTGALVRNSPGFDADERGPAEQVFTQPRHHYTRKLLAAIRKWHSQ
jgi:hypothetical protein